MALIYPDGVKIKDMLYFAKSPVPSAPDIYPIKIKYCRVLRTDLQRGLQVVAADAEASKILANNRAEEDNPDTCSTNSDLTSLPVGAMPVSDAYKFYASP